MQDNVVNTIQENPPVPDMPQHDPPFICYVRRRGRFKAITKDEEGEKKLDKEVNEKIEVCISDLEIGLYYRFCFSLCTCYSVRLKERKKTKMENCIQPRNEQKRQQMTIWYINVETCIIQFSES